jgi:hypothetical protein
MRALSNVIIDGTQDVCVRGIGLTRGRYWCPSAADPDFFSSQSRLAQLAGVASFRLLGHLLNNLARCTTGSHMFHDTIPPWPVEFKQHWQCLNS